MLSETYLTTAEELKRRIAELVPEHPEILEMESPWDLFQVPGFACDDLGPSMAQAIAALGSVQAEHRVRAEGRRDDR